MSLYPNPTQRKITINLGDLDQVNVKVYNVLGKVVQTQTELSNSKIELSLSGDSGVYMIELSSNNSKRMYRVIKQ